MLTPPVVSPQEWQAAHKQLLVKEKAQTRTRDSLAAERRQQGCSPTTATVFRETEIVQ
jgi:predicted dithiol-disulfide oxidoreductase (DUF899 family)